MPVTANVSIVVGRAGGTLTVHAGEVLPGNLPSDEVKRLLELGAAGPRRAPVALPVELGGLVFADEAPALP